jgi:hypothetical protein
MEKPIEARIHRTVATIDPQLTQVHFGLSRLGA